MSDDRQCTRIGCRTLSMPRRFQTIAYPQQPSQSHRCWYIKIIFFFFLFLKHRNKRFIFFLFFHLLFFSFDCSCIHFFDCYLAHRLLHCSFFSLSSRCSYYYIVFFFLWFHSRAGPSFFLTPGRFHTKIEGEGVAGGD